VIRGCTIADNSFLPPFVSQRFGSDVLVGYPATSVTLERTLVATSCAAEIGSGIAVDTGAMLHSDCCVFDPARVGTFGTGMLVEAGNLHGVPSFCGSLGCGSEPAVGGDYQLQAGSLGLAGTSPCGQTIGFYGQGCAAMSRTDAIDWSRLKLLYR